MRLVEVQQDEVGVHAELEVLQRRDAGAAALGHLLAVDGHEAVGVDVIGHAEGLAGKVQHGGPEERVEVDDVLADEVDLLNDVAEPCAAQTHQKRPGEDPESADPAEESDHEAADCREELSHLSSPPKQASMLLAG